MPSTQLNRFAVFVFALACHQDFGFRNMQLRNPAPATQRNYIHHVARFASYYGLSPEKLDLEDIRQFQLYLLNDRQYSPEAVNQSIGPSHRSGIRRNKR